MITLKLACNKLKHGFPSLEVDCNTRIETINPLEDQFKPKKNYSQPIGQLNMDFMKTKPSAKKGFQEGNTHTNPRPAKMLVLQNLV